MARWLLCFLLISLFSVATPCSAVEQVWDEPETKIEQEALTLEGKPILSYAPLARKVAPAVVNISGVHKGGPKPRSLGSGFIISKRGYIVTANNLLDDVKEIEVALLDHRRFTPKIIGRDTNTNVALLKIEADGNLPVIILGDSENLSVGDFVIAIGNPFGSWSSLSAGIVGGIGPSGIVGGMEAGFIQTDASINPSNAGGPLCNITGEVVGVNTALVKGEQPMGFANPINIVKDTLKKFVRKHF